MAKEKGKIRRKIYLCFKRFFDVLLSFLGIIILSPLFIIVSFLSLIILKGNPIYKQYRPGKNNKVFPLLKFRSMTNKTDENGNLLPDRFRITKWGKFLRKTNIDELPQLFNILVGHMSIVGPRPRLIKDVLFYDEEVLKTYTVRPGLTSPCQVNGGRTEASWDSIFEADKLYVENMSLWLDIKTFFQTFISVFKGGGAGAGAEESKREYYYPDHLLKTNQITQEQYDQGLLEAKNFVKDNRTIVEYSPHLVEAETTE